jgi:dinuclear metal center YbgI/SA1388 family protein
MKVQQLMDILGEWAPLSHAEEFDNTGLLVGSPEADITGILITLDCTEAVIDEAIVQGANTIISFHPIIFKGITHLTGKNYVERVVMKAIRADIAIYSMHTALDNAPHGVSARMATALGLVRQKILIPKDKQLLKLVTYVPENSLEQVRQALFRAGAGEVGQYRECSFEVEGTGGFRPLPGSQPAQGEVGQRYTDKEIQLNAVLDRSKEHHVVRALKTSHPYEEVAYEVHPLQNSRPDLGLGIRGELQEPLSEETLMHKLKEVFGTPGIRHSALLGKPVSQVAVLGGSGAFAIPAAIGSGSQVLVTADLKYHQFFQAEGKILLIDIGHYESEQYTKNLIQEYLEEKIHNFAVTLSKVRTNPVFYF